MYARLTNGVIREHVRIPSIHTNDDGSIIMNFNRSSKQEHNALGYYEAEVTEYNKQTQNVGEWVLDATDSVYRRAVTSKDFTSIQFNLADKKAGLIEQVKEFCTEKLKQTDHYVIRKTERRKAIPAAIVTLRAETLAACDAAELEIEAITDYAELLTYNIAL